MDSENGGFWYGIRSFLTLIKSTPDHHLLLLYLFCFFGGFFRFFFFLLFCFWGVGGKGLFYKIGGIIGF